MGGAASVSLVTVKGPSDDDAGAFDKSEVEGGSAALESWLVRLEAVGQGCKHSGQSPSCEGT